MTLVPADAAPHHLGGRFPPSADLFVMRREHDLYVWEIRAEPERALELLRELAGWMPEIVSVAFTCVRTGREYHGEELHLSEVTDTLARIRVPLAASGGVELSVFAGDEQLAVSPQLDLWVFARSDRWHELLLACGLEQVAALPPRDWTVRPDEFIGAPELLDALAATAERLTLRVTPGR